MFRQDRACPRRLPMLLQCGFSGLGRSPHSCGTAPDFHRTYPVPDDGLIENILQPLGMKFCAYEKI